MGCSVVAWEWFQKCRHPFYFLYDNHLEEWAHGMVGSKVLLDSCSIWPHSVWEIAQRQEQIVAGIWYWIDPNHEEQSLLWHLQTRRFVHERSAFQAEQVEMPPAGMLSSPSFSINSFWFANILDPDLLLSMTRIGIPLCSDVVFLPRTFSFIFFCRWIMPSTIPTPHAEGGKMTMSFAQYVWSLLIVWWWGISNISRYSLTNLPLSTRIV